MPIIEPNERGWSKQAVGYDVDSFENLSAGIIKAIQVSQAEPSLLCLLLICPLANHTRKLECKTCFAAMSRAIAMAT